MQHAIITKQYTKEWSIQEDSCQYFTFQACLVRKSAYSPITSPHVSSRNACAYMMQKLSGKVLQESYLKCFITLWSNFQESNSHECREIQKLAQFEQKWHAFNKKETKQPSNSNSRLIDTDCLAIISAIIVSNIEILSIIQTKRFKG